jgi:ankyrin repeat protein
MTDNAVQKPTSDDLAKAIMLNDIKEVESLLQHGADFNDENQQGWNVLTTAANFGRIESVRLLIAAGADVNKKGRYGVTPLMRASITGNIKIAELLLDKGADVSICDDNGDAALHYAESRNLPQVARLLEEAQEVLRRRAAAVEAHALAVKRQLSLKTRAPKVAITGGLRP